MRKAVVRSNDGFVTNIIEIEEGANWQPPEDCYLVDAGDGSPGDTWDGERFVKPELPEPEPQRDLAAELTNLEERVKLLEDKGIL